jgi:hypothetical protein
LVEAREQTKLMSKREEQLMMSAIYGIVSLNIFLIIIFAVAIFFINFFTHAFNPLRCFLTFNLFF